MERELLLELVTTQRTLSNQVTEAVVAVRQLDSKLTSHMETEEKELADIRKTQSKHEALINQAKGARYAVLGVAAFISGVVGFFTGKH